MSADDYHKDHPLNPKSRRGLNHTNNSSVFFAGFNRRYPGYVPTAAALNGRLVQWHDGDGSLLAAFAACLAGLCPFLTSTAMDSSGWTGKGGLARPRRTGTGTMVYFKWVYINDYISTSDK